MRKLKNKKGFTLIELVIVVAVLGIIAVVAVPIVGDIISEARTNTDEAKVALFQSAIERDNAETGAYPGDAAAAKAAIIQWTNLTAVPDPATANNEFWYRVSDGNIVCASSATDYVKISP